MKMRRVVWAYIVFWCIVSVTGCHYNGHDDNAGSSVDGSVTARKRRTTTTANGNRNVTVIGFFPNCIEQRLNQSAGNDSSSSTRRAWKGPVSYVVYHSRWYRNVNRTCWGINDTAECWINNIVNVVRGQSRTLRAAQECVVDYYEEYHGSEYVVDEFPEGTTFEDLETCENIDPGTFEQQLVPFLSTTTPVDDDDVAFTTEFIDDVLEFAKEDLYCPDCSCDDLAEATEYFEAYEFENESCSSCWYTTFATEIDDDTELRDEISQLAFQVAGFTQRQTCPVDYDMDFSNEGVIEDLLRINISCGVDKIVIDMMSCGLVQLGYRKADEVFVTNPNTPIADIYTIPDQCRSKIKKRTDNKITTINFRKDTCDPVISPNATVVTYEFALRNRRPAIDPYATDIQIDRRVYIDFRFKCVYPLLNKPVVLPMDITALHRSVFVSLPPEDPFEVTMSAFRDEDFSVPITTNHASVMIPDPVWIRVTHNGRETAVIDIPSCWLNFPGEGTIERISIFIVLRGCPFKENNGTGSLDGAHSLHTCSSNVASFMFYSFAYTNNSLHIECDVNVYEDVPRLCNQRVCDSSGGSIRRRRRNVLGKIGLDIQPHIRECNECKGYCQCDGVCGCDNTGKPKCFCRRGRGVAEE